MAEWSRDDLLRQARQHLESLRAAGVEWLPQGPPAAVPPCSAAAEGEKPTDSPATVPQVSSSLFDAAQVDAMNQNQTPEKRRHELKLVADKVTQCTRCAELAATRTQTVFGVGQLDPEICFIGEAPGMEEDRQGEPFVGPAGQLLNRILTACGWKREEVYICNVIRCRPPGNHLPSAAEAANCREYLERTLQLVRPKFICCLGACAAQNLLGTTLAIGKLRKRFHDYNSIPVMATYHPAYLLRNPAAKKDVWEDMQMLLARMGKPVPGKN